MKKIVVGITGASGAIYAKLLLEQLAQQKNTAVRVVFSSCGKQVFQHELGADAINAIAFPRYANNDFSAPFASGSSDTDCLIVIPCSMGTLGRIANGIGNDLISRTADVMLKERRKVILVTREAPLHLIHLRNMVQFTEAGGIICPASPSLYSRPNNFEELFSTITQRVLTLAGFEIKGFRWGCEAPDK